MIEAGLRRYEDVNDEIKKELENTELGEDEMLRQALILLAKRNGV